VIDSDVRITPPWLVEAVRKFVGDRLLRDVCTEDDNPVKADLFFTFDSDGLNQRWHELESGTNWCNCPYSRGQVKLWASKCISEAVLGAEILLLTLADVRTAWYRQLRLNADARCHIGRSVGFLEPDGQGGYRQLPGHTMGHAVWYWGQRRRRFESVFSRIGEVIHGLGPQETEAAE